MRLWNRDDYSLHLSAEPGPNEAEQVFDLVWRVDFTTPGFAVLDSGPSIDSPTLRSWMVILKERLSGINVERGGRPFIYRSMGRFDQQETTKFHLDALRPNPY